MAPKGPCKCFWDTECGRAIFHCPCVLQKEDSDWLKKCMEYKVESARPRGRPKKTWRGIVERDCQARKLSREDAIDCNRWRKQIRDD